MEQMDVIMVVICSLFAMTGFVMVVLQKKGKIRPVRVSTSNGFHVTSGGTIALAATIIGVVMLSKYSMLWTILYLALSAGIYIIIQVIFRK